MYLGVDTSCYTTSLSILNGEEIVADERIILDVKQGQRGLRQSDAVFMHMKNMPVLVEKVKDKLKYVRAVCVSETPRREENSYMPVFAAGLSFARVIADSLGVPLYKTTHQEGHIAAAVLTSNFSDNEKFISVHLSGGTSEILLCEKDDLGYNVQIIGKTLDLPAGQLVDRAGVMCGEKFPCGKVMQELAEKTGKLLPVTVKDTSFCLSGAEIQAKRLWDSGAKKEEIYYAVFDCLGRTLEKSLKNAKKKYGIKNVLLCGGVASNAYIRDYLSSNLKDVYFAGAKYSTDNAVGTAYICEGRI